ncbi:MAG: tetratricopeptide repeat protein [Elusimicrobia bacterium]|nr:tetratricopeptide repeat protein [Elusimicrobiota bacterium]
MVEGPFSEVESLLSAGRIPEAVRALKSSSVSAPAWEAFLWLGRIEENRGRTKEAEAAFLKALAAGPRASAPEIEFARFLERQGRHEAALTRLLAALARDKTSCEIPLALGRLYAKMGRLDEARKSLRQAAQAGAASPLSTVASSLACVLQARGHLKAGRFKAASLALRKAGARTPMEAAAAEMEFARLLEDRDLLQESRARLTRARKLGGPSNEIQCALSRVYAKMGRMAAAKASWRRGARSGQGSATPLGQARLPVLQVRSLIKAGRFPAAAKALRGISGPALEEILHEWPEIFSGLLCGGDYRAAFRFAEAMLKKSVRMSYSNVFLWPWWRKVSSRNSPRKMAFCAKELELVRKASAGGGFQGWFAYCRGVLLHSLGRNAEAMAAYEVVKSLRPARYSILHHPFVMNRLLARDFKGTIAACRARLALVPDYWWFQCRLAEALMGWGDIPGGLKEFELAEAAKDPHARQSIITWHGEALLWAGEYRRALSKFDEAVALGAEVWVHCWRGAAHLKLGELKKALPDLDQAIKRDPQDLEAYLWRGEAYRLMGRPARALRDLDRAIALDPKFVWGHFNRALARHAMGDTKAVAEDFAKIPEEVIAAIRGSRKTGTPGPREMRRVLEAGLERAKGIRRPETYLNSIWMGRP